MPTNQEIIEAIEQKTSVELGELIEAVKERFGIEMPSGVIQVPQQEAVVEEEKTEFTVVLKEVGEQKMQVIKTVRSLTSLGLKEAKALVDGAPAKVKEDTDKNDAEAIKKQLEEVGAIIELV